MQFENPIVEGQFIKRYKRFFADVKINGDVCVAHVPNTGSLKSCLNEGALCRLTKSDDPKRKIKFTFEMIQTPTSWVGVNTARPNSLVFEQCWLKKELPHWRDFSFAQREAKINPESRLDMVLWNQSVDDDNKFKFQWMKDKKFRGHFVEVKNVTYAIGAKALFPDSVTERGQKHLRDLMKLMKKGHTAEIIFVIQRMDCNIFSPADAIDPEYGKLLRRAKKEGLIITPLSCELTKSGIQLITSRLGVDL